MTNLQNLPTDILHKILISDGMDVISLHQVSITNHTLSTAIKQYWSELIIAIFANRFPEFACKVDGNLLCSSDVNLKYLYLILENIDKVSKMKKSARYQHLLQHVWSGKLFWNNSKGTRHDREFATLRVLLSFYEYVETVYAENQKTNLNVWGLYPVFDYVSIATDIPGTVFMMPFWKSVIMGRIASIKYQLRFVDNCSMDIKQMLKQLLIRLMRVYAK